MTNINNGFCFATANANAGIGRLGFMICEKLSDKSGMITGWCFVTRPEVGQFDKKELVVTTIAMMAQKYPECIPYLNLPAPVSIDFTEESPRIELPILRRVWYWLTR